MNPLRCRLALVALAFLPATGAAQQSPQGKVPVKTPAEWVAALGDKDEAARDAARLALSSDGPDGSAAIAAMIAALGTPDELVRSQLPPLLTDHGPAAVPPLIRALGRPETVARAGAAEALGNIYPVPA
jgi:HEAT repeat protein